jgi:hypothetical protein
MDWPDICEYVVTTVINKAQAHDRLNKYVYAPYRQALLESFKQHTNSLPESTHSEQRQLNCTGNSPSQTVFRSGLAREAADRRSRAQHKHLSQYFRFSMVDKAAGNFAIMCAKWSEQRLEDALHSATYTLVQTSTATIAEEINKQCNEFSIPQLFAKSTDNRGRASYTIPVTTLPQLYLILKAHKCPIAARPICSTAGTQLANIARAIVKPLNLCREVYAEIWQRISQHFGFATTASWMIKQSSEVIHRIRAVLAEQGPDIIISVFDFSDMFNEFVQCDLVRQIRAFLHLVFAYQSGQRIFATTDTLGPYSTFNTTADPRHSIKVRFSNKHAGRTTVRTAYWSDTDPATQPREPALRLDAEGLAEICEYLLTHAYVLHKGSVYGQCKGIPMGLPTSPQFADMYTGIYELNAVVRLSAALQQGHSHADNDAMVRSMWHWSRMVDDIGTYGRATAEQVYDMLTKTVYPTKVRDWDGSEVQNPMRLNLERTGKSVHYLDLNITVLNNNICHTDLYCKRDELAALRDYRNFPHIESLISAASKYNTYSSALCRMARICNTSDGFTSNAIKLLRRMVQHGYRYERLRRRLYNFRAKYEWIQLQTFHNRRQHISKNIWRRMLKSCNSQISKIKKQSRALRTQAGIELAMQ